MIRWLVFAEATHLGTVLDDTDDLSTRRGGSLLLLHAMPALAKRCPAAKVVSSGASSLLLKLTLEDDAAGEAVVADLRQALVAGAAAAGVPSRADVLSLAPEATFVVVGMAWPAATGFAAVADELAARARLRARRTPCVAVTWVPPAAAGGERESMVCAADHARPGRPRLRKDGEPVKGWPRVSDSVFRRRGYGLKEKQRFYTEELARLGLTVDGLPDRLAADLDEIRDPHPKVRRSVKDKIAVLYLDGNRFGAARDGLINDFPHLDRADEALTAFDAAVREQRICLLHALLCLLVRHGPHAIAENAKTEDPEHQGEDLLHQRVLRLETLLWGGDEIMWVVPGSLGAVVASLLLEKTRRWPLDGGPALTHAIGLVFCHHDAPIGRIRRLAEALAGRAKVRSSDLAAQRTRLAYAVMESFDHAEPERLPHARDLTLTPETWARLTGAADKLATANLPRRQLKRLALLAARDHALDDVRDTLEDEYPDLAPGMAELAPLGDAGWLHLDALWDYLTTPLETAS